MLWVGGHIFLVSLYEIGGHDGLLEGTAIGDALHAPYDLVHHWEEDVHDAIGGALGALAGWLLNTLVSALVGLVVGRRAVACARRVGAADRRSARQRHGEHATSTAASTADVRRLEGRGGATDRPRRQPPRILRIADRGSSLFWSAREIPTTHRCAAQTASTSIEETSDGLQGC